MRSIYRVLSTGVAYNGVNSITSVSQWVRRVTIHNHANVLYHKHELHPMFTQVTCQQKIHCYISMDDNCGEWVKCMGVVSRRRVWLVGVGGICWCG